MLSKNRQRKRLTTGKHRSLFISIALGAIAFSSSIFAPIVIAESATKAETKAIALEAVATSFADSVVIPTYQQLVEKSSELEQAIETFTSNPTDETLQTARTTWLETRYPWEQSEAFAFGPADSLGYDGDLDDWPVNQTDVAAVLNSGDSLTPEYVESLQTTQKGFHTIELLLFGTDNDKVAADFTARELELLQVLTTAFHQSATELATSWSEGVQGYPPYREVLATAGDSSNPAYPTADAAVEEIVQGIIGCLDEVANTKIGEPLVTGASETFESRFSHSSLNDFQNNLRSVENAYLGRISEDSNKAQTSLSDLVAARQPQLDEQVRQELAAAISAVEAIPEPVETKLNDAKTTAQMKAAQAEILTLFSTMQERVLPLVSQQ
ncbi:imelysin family protein [Myxosarcina sp. GI1]|uniref:imelysin family protein n=1 Tax=Myxosarcina sp. GI1 TaxID=1541065 RepID=UPI0009DCE200|nr:imelysin family protein [Myxosarcina sp. GI1]